MLTRYFESSHGNVGELQDGGKARLDSKYELSPRTTTQQGSRQSAERPLLSQFPIGGAFFDSHMAPGLRLHLYLRCLPVP